MATQATTDAQAEKDAKEQQRLAAQATRAAAKEAKAAAKQLRAVAARAKKVASRRLKFQKSRNRAFKEAFSLRERTRWILEREAERRRPAEVSPSLRRRPASPRLAYMCSSSFAGVCGGPRGPVMRGVV